MILQGASSWYGGPFDSGDNNQPALAGASNRTPGIAVLNRSTLGGWWRVTVKNRRGQYEVHTVQQTDLGPAEKTGKVADLNWALIQLLGFNTRNYHNGRVKAEYLGKRKPANAGSSFTTSQTGSKSVAGATTPAGGSGDANALVTALLTHSGQQHGSLFEAYDRIKSGAA